MTCGEPLAYCLDKPGASYDMVVAKLPKKDRP